MIAAHGEIVADHADGAYAAEAPLTEDSCFEPVPYRP
jgi:hypothetical protein